MNKIVIVEVAVSVLWNGAGAVYTAHRGRAVQLLIAAARARATARRDLAAKCLIWEAGCGPIAEQLRRKEQLVAAEHAGLVEARAADYQFRCESLAMRDAADAALLTGQRKHAEGMQALAEATAALAEAQRVWAETRAILTAISEPRPTALDAPEYTLPAPTGWAEPDPRWHVDMNTVFPPARDRVVVEAPVDGWLRVRVPDRSTELIEIPTDRVPAWVLDLAPGSTVYAEVGVSDDPESAFDFAAWQQHSPTTTRLDGCAWPGGCEREAAYTDSGLCYTHDLDTHNGNTTPCDTDTDTEAGVPVPAGAGAR